ncbi:MAG: hypothetical protein U0W24_12665 [Bacteroidales bacterium]
MKKLVQNPIYLILFILLFSNSNVFAQKYKAGAKNFLIRTNEILKYARECVNQNKVYTGKLSQASTHQKHARELFKQGKYKSATYHSQRARTLAFEAIKANKKQVKTNMELTATERDLIKDIPIAAQLDAEVQYDPNYTDEQAAAEKDTEIN